VQKCARKEPGRGAHIKANILKYKELVFWHSPCLG